jgi:hypothetical protein
MRGVTLESKLPMIGTGIADAEFRGPRSIAPRGRHRLCGMEFLSSGKDI